MSLFEVIFLSGLYAVTASSATSPVTCKFVTLASYFVALCVIQVSFEVCTSSFNILKMSNLRERTKNGNPWNVPRFQLTFKSVEEGVTPNDKGTDHLPHVMNTLVRCSGSY